MNYFDYLLAALVGTLSAARITRLITWDKFPPAMWVRDMWDRITNENDWALLFHCPWCMGFWVSVAVLAAGEWSDYNRWWWLVNVAFGLSYVAAFIVTHDGDDD